MRHYVVRDAAGALVTFGKCCGATIARQRELYPDLVEVDADGYAAAHNEMLERMHPEGADHPHAAQIRALTQAS